MPACAAFDKCTACSKKVGQEYMKQLLPSGIFKESKTSYCSLNYLLAFVYASDLKFDFSQGVESSSPSPAT